MKTIKEYIPVGNFVLLTAEYTMNGADEILGDKGTRAVNRFQKVISVGPDVVKDAIFVGDIVDIDVEAFDPVKHLVIMLEHPEDPEQTIFNIRYPLYLIKGVVTFNEQ